MLKIWTTQRASPCSQFSTFLSDLLARRNLCTLASRASVLVAMWCWLHYNEAQGAVFCFCGILMCLWLHFKCFTWFDIATMHVWIQLAIALEYVLIYYYENRTSSIRRDFTRSLSFIILVFGFLESQNALNFYFRRSKFSKFSGEHVLRSLVLASFACKCASHTIGACIRYKTL